MSRYAKGRRAILYANARVASRAISVDELPSSTQDPEQMVSDTRHLAAADGDASGPPDRNPRQSRSAGSHPRAHQVRAKDAERAGDNVSMFPWLHASLPIKNAGVLNHLDDFNTLARKRTRCKRPALISDPFSTRIMPPLR